MKTQMLRDHTYQILGSRVDPTSYSEATAQILAWSLERTGRYICAANVHMVMEAFDSPEFMSIVNQADLITPDGMLSTRAAGDSATPGAGRFYMPQWVAFDEGRLLVDSVTVAEAHVAAMQRYLSTLHLAVSLAPYIFADEEYQRKRNGMLGQLVNQGQALACYWTGEIIGKIRRKAASGQLDRGFSLSLPYFDDQMLEMRMLDFEVIPAGWVMFIPAFVVLAVRREQARVAQDTRLGHSTRMHLLSELKTLERAFEAGDSQ